jgi:hypothetical protein
MKVTIMAYGKKTHSYHTESPVKMIILKNNPFDFMYDANTNTLYLHQTKEKYSLPALLSLSSSLP